MVNMDGLLGG